MKKKTVVILGKTNVGKSSLFNNLLKKSLGIITKKSYTTNRCVEVLCHNYILIDTPGPILKQNKNGLDINKLIYTALLKADILFVLINEILTIDDFFILDLVKNLKKKKFLIITKYDKIKAQYDIDKFILKWQKYSQFNDIFFISNRTLFNFNKFKFILPDFILNMSLFKPDYFLLNDFVRKSLLIYLSKEVPYNVDIQINNLLSLDKINTLQINLKVRKRIYKKIIIGKHGLNLKKITGQLKEDLKILPNIKFIKVNVLC